MPIRENFGSPSGNPPKPYIGKKMAKIYTGKQLKTMRLKQGHLQALSGLASYYDKDLGGFITAASTAAESQSATNLMRALPAKSVNPFAISQQEHVLDILRGTSENYPSLFGGGREFSFGAAEEIWESLTQQEKFAAFAEAADIRGKSFLYSKDYAEFLQEAEVPLARHYERMQKYISQGGAGDLPGYGSGTVADAYALRRYARTRSKFYQGIDPRSFSPEFMQRMGVLPTIEGMKEVAYLPTGRSKQFKNVMRAATRATETGDITTARQLGSLAEAFLPEGGVSITEGVSSEAAGAVSYLEKGKMTLSQFGRRVALEERTKFVSSAGTPLVSYTRGPVPKGGIFLGLSSENLFTKAYMSREQGLGWARSTLGQSKGLVTAKGKFVPIGMGRVIGRRGALDAAATDLNLVRRLRGLSKIKDPTKFIDALRVWNDRYMSSKGALDLARGPGDIPALLRSGILKGVPTQEVNILSENFAYFNQRFLEQTIGGKRRIVSSRQRLSTADLIARKKIASDELQKAVDPLKKNIERYIIAENRRIKKFTPIAPKTVRNLASQVSLIESMEVGEQLLVRIRGREVALTVKELTSAAQATLLGGETKRPMLAGRFFNKSMREMVDRYQKFFPQVRSAIDLKKMASASFDIPVFLRRDVTDAVSRRLPGVTSILTAEGDYLGKLSAEADKILRQGTAEGIIPGMYIARVKRGDRIPGRRGSYQYGLSIVPANEYMNKRKGFWSKFFTREGSMAVDIGMEGEENIIKALRSREQFTGTEQQYIALREKYSKILEKHGSRKGSEIRAAQELLEQENKMLRDQVDNYWSQKTSGSSWIQKAKSFYSRKPKIAWGITAGVAAAGFLMAYGATRSRKPIDMGEGGANYRSGADGTSAPQYSPRTRIAAMSPQGRSTDIGIEGEGAGDMRYYQEAAREAANYAGAQLASGRVGVDFNIQDYSQNINPHMMHIQMQDMLRRQ